MENKEPERGTGHQVQVTNEEGKWTVGSDGGSELTPAMTKDKAENIAKKYKESTISELKDVWVES
jgi:hypothetical protein